MQDVFYLTMLITLPFILPVIVAMFLYGNGSPFLSRLKGIFVLRFDEGLSGQCLLWLSITIPLLYAICLAMIAWNGYEISLTSEGLKTFISISAMPITIASLSIPLSVLVARFHSSGQTATQIKITRQKNNVDLFHAHRKELFSYFSQIGEMNYQSVFTAKYKVHPRLHRIAFKGKPIDGQPVCNERYFKDLNIEINTIANFLDKVVKHKTEDVFSYYALNLSPKIYHVSMLLGLPEIFEDIDCKSITIEEDIKGVTKKFTTIGTTTLEAIVALRYIYNFYLNLCDFADYKYDDIDKEFSYLFGGDEYKTAYGYLVIEYLHAEVISRRKIIKMHS
ncbi:hypothetical protein [Rahnella sikkimica]|uniref:Uncharacterized protein n=1 Tax=Rahnella sikkimica TaxID=1805933 RepID=A0A2L1UQ98_9GAMM|nr:hypothetical protein [Rahnella sikkimica]AVF35104.1 hypothetical protein BV494_09235 [Rahnella sikkimica]